VKSSELSAFIKRVWLAALILCVVPFLVATLFAHPFYDDYRHAVLTREHGVLGAVGHTYFTVSGRYFSTLLLALHPLIFGGTIIYKLVAFVIILLVFICVYFLVSVVVKKDLAPIDKLIAASFFTALYSNQMPELTEGYYWMPGSISYTVGVILTVFFFGSVVNLWKSVGRERLIWLITGCVLMIGIIGSNETIMAVFVLLMLAITIKTFVARDGLRWHWLAFMLTASLCTLVVVLAPGNAVRESYSVGQHRLFYSLIYSSAQEARFLLKWLSNPALILGTILFIPVAARLSEKNELFKRHFHFHPLIALFLLLVIVFMGFFPAYWSLGILGQHRSVTLVFFLFLVGWFLNAAMWTAWLRQKRGWAVASLPVYVYVICLLLIPLSLLATNNTSETIQDLATGRAPRYDKQMSDRYSHIERCSKTGESPCVIKMLTDLPTSITSDYINELTPGDAQYWKVELRQEESSK
jgi:hypothetical protein